MSHFLPLKYYFPPLLLKIGVSMNLQMKWKKTGCLTIDFAGEQKLRGCHDFLERTGPWKGSGKTKALQSGEAVLDLRGQVACFDC